MQDRHRKTAWLSRFSAVVCPHVEHRWLVYAGLAATTTTGEAAATALLVRCVRNSAYAFTSVFHTLRKA